MSEREIHGATISFNCEHLGEDGHSRCNNCESRTLLVLAPGEWEVDKEPFKDGEETAEGVPSEVFVGEITGHFCPTCEILVSLSYNFS